MVPVQRDQVALVHEADGGHHPAIAIRRNICFQHVIAQLGIAKKFIVLWKRTLSSQFAMPDYRRAGGRALNRAK